MGPLPLNLTLPALPGAVRRILKGQLLNCCPLFLLILQNPDSTENNHTAEISRVFLRNNLILVDHAERNMSILPYCIQFVAAFSAVEIEILPVIYI